MTDENGTPQELSPAEAAAATLNAFSDAQLTTGTAEGVADLPPVHFNRLSVERRVLGHITDDVDKSALGPRNTLAALTYGLMTDRNTTHPPATHPRLSIEGKSVAEVAQEILDIIEKLEDAGLVAQREDGSYYVTDAGVTELGS